MKILALVLVSFVGCGDCIPSSVKSAASVGVAGAPATSLKSARSGDELKSVSGPGVEAFVAATDFATTDVALVRAGGGDRARLAGETTSGDRVTLYFTGQCSPCGGGNPGSYQDAKNAQDAAEAPRTELVRVPKGARVEVRVCGAECGACTTNVP